MPDVLKLNAILTAKPLESDKISLENQIYVLQKVDHSCDEDFLYEIPATTYSFLVIFCLLKDLLLIFKWDEHIILDFHGVIIKPDFIDSRHILTGAYETIYMSIVLKHRQIPHIPHLQ